MPLCRCAATGYVQAEQEQGDGWWTYLLDYKPPPPPPPPSPLPAGCYGDDANGPVSYKYAPGRIRLSMTQQLTDSAADCCKKCRSFKNQSCVFWTFEYGGNASQPSCYGKPGACCFLNTADAGGAGSPGEKGVTVGGSINPLPPPVPPGQHPYPGLAFTHPRIHQSPDCLHVGGWHDMAGALTFQGTHHAFQGCPGSGGWSQ